MYYEPFAQNGTFSHQILQPYPKFINFTDINKSYLPVLANGNAGVVLGYIGRALHEIFWVCGQFDLNFGSKTMSAELRGAEVGSVTFIM